MRLAIVIGVSKYTAFDNLPACASDAALIHDILSKTGRFDHVLELSTDAPSKTVKQELSQFLATHKPGDDTTRVDEVFFYFTGHGDLQGDDVVFLLSDYDEKRVKRTSLSNIDVDTMLRSLRPRLTVKVVDACHSGVAYIKDKDALKKSLAASEDRFDRCYFMFSSHKDQVSFQDPDHLSAFTESFARAITTHTGASIRYKDIADFISDDFSGSTDQTPPFVVQADLTEIFCEVTEVITAAIGSVLNKTAATAKEAIASGTGVSTLTQLVMQDAERYCDEGQAMSSLDRVIKVARAFQLKGELADLYSANLEEMAQLDDSSTRRPIAKWLKENANTYFVRLTYTDQQYQSYENVKMPPPAGLFSAYQAFLSPQYETVPVTKTRTVLDGYELTVAPAITGIRIFLTPKFQNLVPWRFSLTFVFSKVDLRFFYRFEPFKNITWTEHEPLENRQWKTSEVRLKDAEAVEANVSGILSQFTSTVLKDLKVKFGTEGEQPSAKETASS